jgi:hypothetical protein
MDKIKKSEHCSLAFMMGNFWDKPVKPNQTSLEEDNWTKGLRVVLLENIQPLEAAGNTTEP